MREAGVRLASALLFAAILGLFNLLPWVAAFVFVLGTEACRALIVWGAWKGNDPAKRRSLEVGASLAAPVITLAMMLIFGTTLMRVAVGQMALATLVYFPWVFLVNLLVMFIRPIVVAVKEEMDASRDRMGTP